MKRRALVIGSRTGDLTGVNNDADIMATLLRGREFEVDVRTGGDATRDGIYDAYRSLIGQTGRDDAVAVYYSGHGGLARVFTDDDIALPELQFIVPTDYDESTPGDFRGITATELSVLLKDLTDRTHNVAVMLDCCHAGHMSRDRYGGLLKKGLSHPTYLDIGMHLGRLRERGIPIDGVDPISNPYAVRVVACAPWELAYEYTNPQGLRIGLATDSLRIALEEARSDRVTWSTLIQRVRNRVSTLASLQRPGVEGPSRRLLFDTEQAPAGSVFAVDQVRPDRLAIAGAALLGVAPGDQFGITKAGEPHANDQTMVARATVGQADGVTVHASFELCAGHTELPAMAEAHPLVTSAARETVVVRGTGPLAAQLRTSIDATTNLRSVGPQERAPDEAVVAEVVVTDALALYDGGSEPLRTGTGDSTGIGQIVGDLVRLGRTAVLRRLSPTDDEALTDEFTVEWGRVVAGRAEPLPRGGALLHAGEAVYLRLRNDSPNDLYFFVFDLGVAGATHLLNASDPGGLRLRPNEERYLGQRAGSALRGSPLIWPPGVPEGEPREETLMVIVTSAPHDLAVLAHEGVHTARVTPRGSSLRQALAAAVWRASREWAPGGEDAGRYAVARLDFELSPVPAPVREATRFLVDERGSPWRRPTSRSLSGPPTTVAVRLNELIVHRNRALRGAEVRVDALVITGGGADMPRHSARTARFHNVRDGDRLPLDNLLVYQGPVVDYLDLAWWVSRDRRDSQALNDMLRAELTSEAFTQAMQSVAALATTSGQAALAVAAVSGCAVIVTTAYRLLSAAVDDTIGLYRTSLLATEGFGVGRHPSTGTRLAQDFSFAYEIVATG